MPLTRFTWLRRSLLALAALALLLAVAFVMVRYLHVDNRVVRWLRDQVPGHAWNQPRWQGHSLWLPGYRYDIQGRVLEGVDDNLSGLSYDAGNDRLLAVINRPSQLLVLDGEGRVLQRHRLQGASDVEAIAWLGDDEVALLQEGRRSVIVARLPAGDGEPIDVTRARVIALEMDEAGNNGPEGLAYDAAGDVLYVAKERSPTALYELRGVLRGETVQVDRSAWLKGLDFATDISSLEFDPAHRHLLLLSDESQLLAEIAADGRPVSWRSLANWNGHLPVPQAEGVALGRNGTLYVVSEPNLFYRLQPATAR
ncbi:SdiA-regulated domain-containing protein [Stenotrophomonas sp. MMGLT7]|nr:SdiA-regulated domain-containing protein [Stenotrophomonas sp. MMGLT7]